MGPLALKEGFALKNVRVFYKKRSRLKFVSHLDMNRFITRMIRQTEIPVWYTEGFNSHAYINFALPLSLGFESDYEILDFKLIDDNYPIENIADELKRVMPKYVEIIKAAEPVFKTGKIAFAEFEINFEDEGRIEKQLIDFLNSGNISIVKRNKKGKEVELQIADKIKSFEIISQNATQLKIILPAGGSDNVNPVLLLSAFEKEFNLQLPFYSITRTMLYTEDMSKFI